MATRIHGPSTGEDYSRKGSCPRLTGLPLSILMLLMASPFAIDFDAVWAQILREFRGDPDSIHGLTHWRRVEQNGLRIAASNGAAVEVVRLFAVLHDSQHLGD